jgi:hypothetical protein
MYDNKNENLTVNPYIERRVYMVWESRMK